MPGNADVVDTVDINLMKTSGSEPGKLPPIAQACNHQEPAGKDLLMLGRHLSIPGSARSVMTRTCACATSPGKYVSTVTARPETTVAVTKSCCSRFVV